MVVHQIGHQPPTAQAVYAVFLPAAGRRGGSSVYSVQKYGGYWSATESDSSYAGCLDFVSDGANMLNYNRTFGLSVRLVKDL